MSHFTLETGQRDIILALMTQGVGFACLFVPLTTVALSRDPAPQDGGRDGPQLALPPGRRLDRPRHRRDAAHALRRPGAHGRSFRT